MFAATPIVADLFSNMGRILIGLFAVAGAFVVGYLLTGIVMWLLYRRFSKAKRCHPLLMRVYRLVGGVLLSLIVAVLFLGEGGLGLWGGGTDDGPHGTGEKGSLVTDDKKAVDDKNKEVAPPEKKKGDVPAESRVRITMLGDEAREERFYLFESDSEPRTFKELQELIRRRMKASAPALEEVSIHIFRNTADRDNPIVKDLDRWEQEQGLRVSYWEFRDKNRPGS